MTIDTRSRAERLLKGDVPAVIDEFSGRWRFLSNFYPAVITWGYIVYPTVEHAFQSAKTFDMDIRQIIAAAPTPGKAKRLGRKVMLRRDWDQVKIRIMLDLLQRKFANPILRMRLLATKDAQLVEGNDWGDVFWGVCFGKGDNHLGKLLMKVREEIRP